MKKIFYAVFILPVFLTCIPIAASTAPPVEISIEAVDGDFSPGSKSIIALFLKSNKNEEISFNFDFQEYSNPPEAVRNVLRAVIVDEKESGGYKGLLREHEQLKILLEINPKKSGYFNLQYKIEIDIPDSMQVKEERSIFLRIGMFGKDIFGIPASETKAEANPAPENKDDDNAAFAGLVDEKEFIRAKYMTHTDIELAEKNALSQNRIEYLKSVVPKAIWRQVEAGNFNGLGKRVYIFPQSK